MFDNMVQHIYIYMHIYNEFVRGERVRVEGFLTSIRIHEGKVYFNLSV